MTHTTRIHISGDPVACPRPRVTKTGRTYYPARYDAWRRAAALEVRAQLAGADPLRGPVVLEVVIVHPRPKRAPRGLKAWWGPGRVVKATRPDIDNGAKAVLDALDAGGLLSDDGQVVALTVCEWYAAEDEDSGVSVTARLMSP